MMGKNYSAGKHRAVQNRRSLADAAELAEILATFRNAIYASRPGRHRHRSVGSTEKRSGTPPFQVRVAHKSQKRKKSFRTIWKHSQPDGSWIASTRWAHPRW